MKLYNSSWLAILALPVLSLNVQAQEMSLEERLRDQQARIDQLEAGQYQSPASELSVRISGFVNAGAQSTNLGKGGPEYVDTDNEVRYSNFTTAGVQFNAELSRKVSGAVQLLSEGSEDFDTQAEWAYIAYEITPSLTARAGRLVAPYYMHSQYYDVGYAYPWVELPAEVYLSAPVRNYEGIDLTWRFNTGSITHSLNIFHGGTSISDELGDSGVPTETRVHNQVGVNLSSTMGNLTSWLSYTNSDIDLQFPDLTAFMGPDLSPYSLDNDSGHFAGAGLQYDNGSVSLMAEYIGLGVTTEVIPSTEAGYVTAGYRIGDWMPHVTWATTEDTSYSDVSDDPLAASLYNGIKRHQKSWTFGVRGDIATNLALKAEVSRYYDIGNDENGATPDNGYFSGPIPDDEDDPMVFRVAANLVF